MTNPFWTKLYPNGVPTEINPDKYQSIMELFEECFMKFKDNPGFINMDKGLTYGEIDHLSKNFAAYLQHLGLKPGDRIALQMPNLLQYPVAMFGALRAGLVVVNTNPLYTPREMEHQFKDSGAIAIVILENFAHHLEHIIDKTSIKHVIVASIGDLLGGLKGMIVNFVVRYVKKMVPKYKISGVVKFNDAISMGRSHQYRRPDIKNSDLAFLQYTGGTTGVSKGAMLTHRNMLANLEQCSAWWIPKLKENVEIIITPLPLYHIFSLTANCLSMIKLGAKIVLITNPKDIPGFIKELKKYPFTVLTGVNTLFNGLMNNPDFASVDFSSFKIAVGGGMAVQKAVAEKWEKITGIPIVEGYGLTETSPVLSCNPVDGTQRIGTIGLPFPSTDIKILDEDENEVPLGVAGEICAKGPQVMPGYFEKPEETKNVFSKDGYFKTGDIGLIEEDGFVRIVDRKKDMIIVSGFKVFPNEIEDVLAGHPGVLEVAAVGVADEKSTEAVKVFIVKKDQNLTEENLRTFAKENFTSYKVPKYYEFRTELPKSNVGKILRRMLKEDQKV